MNYQIFISYRRSGASELAQLLYTRLTSDGYATFYDVESLRSGRFNKQLYDRIDECSDVLVLLPPKALDPRETGEDWVRMEIAYALQQGKNIIPVLMRDFTWPEQLPEDIEELKYCHGVSASMEYFDAVFAKMKDLLQCEPKKANKQSGEVIDTEKQLHLAELLLKNNNFEEAMTQYDRILLANVECGEAYLGKLMAEFQLHNKEEFAEYFKTHLIYDHINYKLLCEYADGELKVYIDNLEYPVCKNDTAKATHQCDKCHALICDTCANELETDPENVKYAAWTVGKTLCPECMKILHEHCKEMRSRNMAKITLYYIGVVLGMIPPIIFAIANKEIGPFFVGLGIEYAIVYVIREMSKTDPSYNQDAEIGCLGILIYAALFTFAAPFISIFKLCHRIYWIIRMKKIVDISGALVEQDGVRDKRYLEAYYEMVRIARALGATVPDGMQEQE